MAIGMFETRSMLPVLNQTKRPSMFLLDTFFPRAQPVADKKIQIDVRKGKRRVAPYVNPRHEGKVVEGRGYTAWSFEPPYLKPKIETQAGDLLNRRPGELTFGDKTPQQRAQEKLGEDLAELDDMVSRREEQQAADVLHDGKVSVSGDAVEATIDFGLDSTHIIGTSDLTVWNDGSETPIDDMKGWRRTIIQDSGINPNTAVMGADAIDAFIDSSEVQEKMDKRRLDLGTIDPRQLPGGVTYYGFIPEIGCDIYSYDDWYVDSEGNENPMIDPKSVIMGSTNARAETRYAAIQDLKVGDAAVQRFPKTWEEEDPSVRWLLMQAAPLVCMLQPDAFLRATVLS